MVGEIEVDRPYSGQTTNGRGGVGGTEVVAVGVRTDSGQLMVQCKRDNDRNFNLPPLSVDKAHQLADMLTRGAAMAGGLRQAYEAYREALREAEDKLRAAMAVHNR